MSSSTTLFESTSSGSSSASNQSSSTSRPLFASSSDTVSTPGPSTPTLASGTSRTVSESQSVYINTSYVYSRTLTASSTAILPTDYTMPSSSQTESSTRRDPTTTKSPAVATPKAIVPSAGQPLLQGPNGLILNLTLAGDDVGQAVYSVPMVFGHPSGSQYYETTAVFYDEDDENQSRKRDIEGVARSSGKTKVFDPKDMRKPRTAGLRARQRSDSKEKRAPGTYQSMNLQVDLGSSDLVSLHLCEGNAAHLQNLVGCRFDMSDVRLQRERSAKAERRPFHRCSKLETC